MTFLLALPLAITMRGLLQAHLGASLAADGAADGVNYDWWQEFTSQATGLGDDVLADHHRLRGHARQRQQRARRPARDAPDRRRARRCISLAWTFLAGGIIDRYARQRPTARHGFFAASGVHVFRLLRLAVVSGAGLLVALCLRPPAGCFSSGSSIARARSASSATSFFWRVALYVAVRRCCSWSVNVIFDYAKIRLVVEDRRSALGALSAAHAIRLAASAVASPALYALNGLAFLDR